MTFKITWIPGKTIEGYIWMELSNMIIIQADCLYAVNKKDITILNDA